MFLQSKIFLSCFYVSLIKFFFFIVIFSLKYLKEVRILDFSECNFAHFQIKVIRHFLVYYRVLFIFRMLQQEFSLPFSQSFNFSWRFIMKVLDSSSAVFSATKAGLAGNLFKRLDKILFIEHESFKFVLGGTKKDFVCSHFLYFGFTSIKNICSEKKFFIQDCISFIGSSEIFFIQWHRNIQIELKPIFVKHSDNHLHQNRKSCIFIVRQLQFHCTKLYSPPYLAFGFGGQL